MHDREAGLTLLELLIVLVVTGVLLSLTGPAFQGMVQDSRDTAGSNQLLGHLHFARQRSTELGVPVSLCPSEDGRHCLADQASWHQGWIVYRHQDPMGSAELVKETQILQVASSPPGGLQANRHRFTLRSDGRRSTNGTFLICQDHKPRRAIIINVMGRARSTRDPARMPTSC